MSGAPPPGGPARVAELHALATLPAAAVVGALQTWAASAFALLPASLSPRLRALAASAAPDRYTQALALLQQPGEPREGAGILPLLAATQLLYDPAAFLAGSSSPAAPLPILLPPRTPLLPTPTPPEGPALVTEPTTRAAAATAVLDKAIDAVKVSPACSAALLALRLAHANAEFLAGNVKGAFEADVYAVVGTNSRTTIGADLAFARPGQLPGRGLDALFDPGPPPAEPWQLVFPLAHLTHLFFLYLVLPTTDNPEGAISKGEAWFKRLLTSQSAAQDVAYAAVSALQDAGSSDPVEHFRAALLMADIDGRAAAAVQEVQSVLYILNGRALDAAQGAAQLARSNKTDPTRIPYLLYLASIASLLAPASAARDRVLDTLASDVRLEGDVASLVHAAAAGRPLGPEAANTLRSHVGAAGLRPVALSANDKALFAASPLGPDGRPHAVTTALEYALATHNVRAASGVYSRISLARLGELVGLSTVGTEALVRTLVREQRLAASVDQKASTITFAPPGRTVDALQVEQDDDAAPGTVAVESSADTRTGLVPPLDLRRVVADHAAAHAGTTFVPQSEQAAQGATAAVAMWDARVAAVSAAVEKIHFALSVRDDVPAL